MESFEYPKNLLNIERIGERNNEMIKNREQLATLIESPLLFACQELYDKNIMTLSSSANKENTEVYITIDFDSLSEKNKVVAKSFGEVKFNVETNTNTVQIFISVKMDDAVENISAKAMDIAHKFEKQPLLWANKYTLDELRSMYGYTLDDEEMGITDFANGELDSYFYDPASKLFYDSEELYKKVTE
jgi:hypothetical protein